jgi:hypothetical protein
MERIDIPKFYLNNTVRYEFLKNYLIYTKNIKKNDTRLKYRQYHIKFYTEYWNA